MRVKVTEQRPAWSCGFCGWRATEPRWLPSASYLSSPYPRSTQWSRQVWGQFVSLSIHPWPKKMSQWQPNNNKLNDKLAWKIVIGILKSAPPVIFSPKAFSTSSWVVSTSFSFTGGVSMVGWMETVIEATSFVSLTLDSGIV